MGTHYVDTTIGNNANTGGVADPWQTIQYALTNCSLPAVIYLTGTDAVATNITWRTAGTTTPIIIIGGAISYLNRTSAVAAGTATNYTFYGCDQIGIGGGNFFANMNGRFVGCLISARTPGGSISGAPVYADFIDCTLNCGMSVPGSYINCTVTDGSFIYTAPGKSYIGCKLIGGSYISIPFVPTIISHCSFHGNSAAPFIGLWNNAQLSAVVVENCVFESTSARNAVGGIVGATTGYILGHGNVIAGSTTMYAASFSNVVTDDTQSIASALTNPTSGDWSPTSALAAIEGTDGLIPGAVPYANASVAAGITGFRNRITVP